MSTPYLSLIHSEAGANEASSPRLATASRAYRFLSPLWGPFWGFFIVLSFLGGGRRSPGGARGGNRPPLVTYHTSYRRSVLRPPFREPRCPAGLPAGKMGSPPTGAAR